jgi:hypothetical protein
LGFKVWAGFKPFGLKFDDHLQLKYSITSRGVIPFHVLSIFAPAVPQLTLQALLLPPRILDARVQCHFLGQLCLECPVLETAADLGRLTNSQYAQATTT